MSFTQPYVDIFQSIDPIVAKIVEELAEKMNQEIGDLKVGLEKEIQYEEEILLIKMY